VLVHPLGHEYVEASGIGQPGVRIKPIAEFTAKPDRIFRRIPHPDPALVWAWAVSQACEDYDWGFLFGWLCRRKWDHPARWTCNDLIAWAADRAGHPIINMDNPHWLTPEHLYLISLPCHDHD